MIIVDEYVSSQAGGVVRPDIELHRLDSGAGPLCRRILGQLPEWFGIPEAVEHYVDVADHCLTVVASIDEDDVGFLTIVRHTPWAAEIEVMGVMPGYHRQGVGRRMLGCAETILRREGVEYLQVKTLAPTRPNAHYDRTRAFYTAVGFRPLQVFPTLWGVENPALQLVKALPGKR